MGPIVITDRDGFTRTIEVTRSTVYAGGLSATPTTGTRIHAEGTVDSNGTSLDATRITRQPQHPAAGPGSHAKPGPAGPGTPGGGPRPK